MRYTKLNPERIFSYMSFALPIYVHVSPTSREENDPDGERGGVAYRRGFDMKVDRADGYMEALDSSYRYGLEYELEHSHLERSLKV